MRNIDSEIQTYADAATGTYPVELLHINVGTNPYNFQNIQYDPDLYLTTCYKDIVYNGQTYIASNSLLGLSTIEETQEAKTNAVKITLNGVPNTIIGALNVVNAIGGNVTIYQAFFDDATGDIYESPNTSKAIYQKWKGVINSHSVDEDNSNGTVTIEVEAKNIVGTILNTKSGRFTSDTSIQRSNSGDRSAEFVAQLVDFNPFFGREN